MADTSTRYSCHMKAKWDFADNSNTGKHTEGREIYRLNSLRMDNAGDDEDEYGFAVIEAKNKVRGNGRSLVLRFESVTGKDFEILGWAMEMSANSQG